MNSLSLRISILVEVLKDFPELGSPRYSQFRNWVCSELGGLTVLDRFEKRGDYQVRAIAPRTVLIVGAGNLVVSLWQALISVLVLGVDQITIKPGTGTERECLRFIKRLPHELKKRIRLVQNDFLNNDLSYEAVIALGKDQTLFEIQKKLTPKQRFIAYGHRVSGIWIENQPRDLSVYRLIVSDIVAFDQQGCLSPRWIALSKSVDAELFCKNLSKAFLAWRNRMLKKRIHMELSPSEEAMIFEMRQLHRALGNSVWGDENDLFWTLILNHSKHFELSVLPRVIDVFQGSLSDYQKLFSEMKGDLSTVGYDQWITPSVEKFFIDWGASRFCPVGKMQKPPLDWLHDGRPSLADLVRWVQKD